MLFCATVGETAKSGPIAMKVVSSVHADPVTAARYLFLLPSMSFTTSLRRWPLALIANNRFPKL